MRAVVFDEFGGPEVLRVTGLRQPEPEPGEILIRVVASGVNPVDWKTREGMLEGMIPHEFPIIPGWEAAGLVEALGDGASRFRKGDRVWTYARKPVIRFGTYAEYLAVQESSVSKMPPGILYEEAAAVPLAGLTAYQALFDEGRLEQGHVVLVHAAAGGVGHFATQLARNAGATVIGTGSPANFGFMSDNGVEHLIDYTREDFAEATRRFCPDGIDLVLDSVGGEVQQRSLELLRPGGGLVTIAGGPVTAEEAAQRSVRFGFVFVEPNSEQLDILAGQVDAGKLKIHVSKIYPLDQAREAQEASKAGHVRGKLVLAL